MGGRKKLRTKRGIKMKGKIKNAQVEYDSNDDIKKIKLEEREDADFPYSNRGLR